MESTAKAFAGIQIPNRQQAEAQAASMFADPAVKELAARYPFHKFRPNELLDYAIDHRACRTCPGLENCPNQQTGYRRRLDPESMAFVFQPCEPYIAEQNQRKISHLVKSHNMPDRVMQMTFDQLEIDAERAGAIKAAMKFCVNYERGKTTEGLFLKGKFGTGKSAIVGAMTQQLAKKGVDVVAVYWPDFMVEIKNAINSGKVEEKLEALRSASVLIIDDIGAEPCTIWGLKEVLGTILQARMERRPTIYTSNLTMPELETHFARPKDAKNAGASQLQLEKDAARIMERIEPYVQVYTVGGRNRRRRPEGA